MFSAVIWCALALGLALAHLLVGLTYLVHHWPFVDGPGMDHQRHASVKHVLMSLPCRELQLHQLPSRLPQLHQLPSRLPQLSSAARVLAV